MGERMHSESASSSPYSQIKFLQKEEEKIIPFLFIRIKLILLYKKRSAMAGAKRKRSVGVNLLCLLMVWVMVFCEKTSAKLQIFHEQPTKGDGTLSFLVIGDWGRKGEFNQSQVASQMGRIGKELDVDFIVSTGDNFYENGLNGVSDQAFVQSFTNVYTADSLQKQWFSVLGNHDYRGDVLAQMSPALTKIDHRWLCLRSFVVQAEIVDIIFVDTTPFVEEYFTNPDGHTYDWRGVLPKKRYLARTLSDVELTLKKSKAKWKIVVGHHAIRSVGHHGDTPELIHHLLPILKAYNVDFYINGHDHCLEHISDNTSPIQFLTSGAGSKAWRGDVKSLNCENLKFFYDGQGFMSVELTALGEGKIAFYDVFGRVVHRWASSKQPLHFDIR